jgi:hypothetical protein
VTPLTKDVFEADFARYTAVGACRFVVELAAEGVADGAAVDGADSIRSGVGRRMLPVRVGRLKLPVRPALPITFAATPRLGSSGSSISDSQRSHKIHPTNVAKLLQLVTATGDTRSWFMPTKQTTNMMTEHTCCSMTVESATRGQKSYGLRRGLRWRFSRKVAWSV